MVDAMQHMAYSSRDLHRAAAIYVRMLEDKEGGVILCLAGSLISAGLKKIFVDMIRNKMVDAIVSTGANIVDQDFFEALGFKHYRGEINMADDVLRRLAIDRMYDTYIAEEQLRICAAATGRSAAKLQKRAPSSRGCTRARGRPHSGRRPPHEPVRGKDRTPCRA